MSLAASRGCVPSQCQALRSEQRIELAAALQGMQVIAAAHMAVVDEDLGKRAAAAGPVGHGVASVLIAVDGVFAIRHPLAIEQLLGADAEGAEAPGVDLDLGHRSSWVQEQAGSRTAGALRLAMMAG